MSIRVGLPMGFVFVSICSVASIVSIRRVRSGLPSAPMQYHGSKNEDSPASSGEPYGALSDQEGASEVSSDEPVKSPLLGCVVVWSQCWRFWGCRMLEGDIALHHQVKHPHIYTFRFCRDLRRLSLGRAGLQSMFQVLEGA